MKKPNVEFTPAMQRKVEIAIAFKQVDAVFAELEKSCDHLLKTLDRVARSLK